RDRPSVRRRVGPFGVRPVGRTDRAARGLRRHAVAGAGDRAGGLLRPAVLRPDADGPTVLRLLYIEYSRWLRRLFPRVVPGPLAGHRCRRLLQRWAPARGADPLAVGRVEGAAVARPAGGRDPA